MSVVKEVEAAMRIQAEKKKLSLIVDFEQASNYCLSGDPFRLRQILYNVLGNAVKFTAQGYVKLAVRTRPAGDRISCEFEITDTGIGIRQEDLHKIFNQFEQADTSITRNFGGTGLGLTIVKSLIEALGGNLRVNSSPGSGSTFSIQLDFDRGVSGKSVAETTRAHHEHSENDISLLVVDDDPMILRLCGLILEKNEISHKLFDDPEELLNEIPDPEVTHILMDIRMPKMNGVELCHELRKKYPSKTKFIALTAHVFEQDKKHLYEHGFDHVLSKPFHEEELLNFIGFSSGWERTEVASAEAYTVDLAPLRNITMNDEALFQSVLQQFVQETTIDLSLLDGALETSNKRIAREVFHKLAGRIGQMGILPLSMKLREMEMKIENGEDLGNVVPMISVLREEVSKVVKLISAHALEKSS